MIMKKVPILKNIEDYKDLYKGEICFIIGNGPSLKKTNLDLLMNDYTFAMNQINLIYDMTKWRPSVYGSFSSRINDKKWRNNIIENINLNIPVFLGLEMDKKLEEHGVNCDNVMTVKSIGNAKCNPNDDKQWSNDASKLTTKYGTTLMGFVQISIYMGFENIYLIGCDLGYGGNTPDHFVDGYLGSLGTNYNRWIEDTHKLMDRMSKKQGVTIRNATIGGHLEIYPRVEYEKLF